MYIEKYKSATTVKHFYDLGGTKGDLKNDYMKGFIKLVDPIHPSLSEQQRNDSATTTSTPPPPTTTSTKIRTTEI